MGVVMAELLRRLTEDLIARIDVGSTPKTGQILRSEFVTNLPTS